MNAAWILMLLSLQQVHKDGTVTTPDGKRVKIVDPRGNKKSQPSKSMDPLVHEGAEAALEVALKRNQPAVVAVGMVEEGDIPPLFREASIARSSRATVSLASIEYFSEDEFFKSRRITKDQVPCVLILDPYGNVMDLRTGTFDPQVILASARNVRTLMRNLLEEIPKVLAQADALAAQKDEKKLLELLRPWLKRHLRGYPDLERLNARVEQFGKPRLEAAKDLESLEKLAAEYADTTIEAAAVLAMAKLQDQAGKREEAKVLLRRLLNDLPWTENAAFHQEAGAMLKEYRRQEIERRKQEEEEKLKKP